MTVGIEGLEIGNEPSVSYAWKTTNDKELSNKNFFDCSDTEEIEYSETSRQLMKEETIRAFQSKSIHVTSKVY